MEKLSFNEWLMMKMGVSSEDMTDEDYDYWYAEYERETR